MAAGFDRSPRYLVHQRLAAGGMGEVYLGTMVSYAGRRPVAIKRVSVDRLRDSGAVARLVAEARLGFQLTHANVCQVIDLVFSEEGAYIVMELVRGLDFRELLQQRSGDGRRLDPPMALYVTREVARALDYAHRLGGEDRRPLHIVHGDVTPQNILVSLEGEVKLADFGIARALGTAAPGTDVVGGTRGYIAPEIASGVIDHRSDIFSLGATLHAALVGEPPAAPGVVTALRERPEVPKELVPLVARAIAREPRDRFLSAGELEGALAFELARRYPGFTPSALAATVRAVRNAGAASDEIGDETATLFALASQSATLATASELVAPWQTSDAVTAVDEDDAPPVRETAAWHATRTLSAGAAAPPRRRAVVAIAALLTLLSAAGVVAAWSFWHREAPRVVAGGVDAAPVLTADVARPDAGAIVVAVVDAAPADEISPAAADAALDATAAADEPPPRRVRRERRERRKSRTEPAYLSVNATPWGAVEVDGRRVAAETPLYRLRVRPGKRRVTVIFGDGVRSDQKVVTLSPGEHKNLGFRR